MNVSDDQCPINLDGVGWDIDEMEGNCPCSKEENDWICD
jgi:hypothetical protein